MNFVPNAHTSQTLAFTNDTPCAPLPPAPSPTALTVSIPHPTPSHPSPSKHNMCCVPVCWSCWLQTQRNSPPPLLLPPSPPSPSPPSPPSPPPPCSPSTLRAPRCSAEDESSGGPPTTHTRPLPSHAASQGHRTPGAAARPTACSLRSLCSTRTTCGAPWREGRGGEGRGVGRGLVWVWG